MTSKKIWIVAAGTGGHIFPGLSVAEYFQKSGDYEFEFFGSRDRLESKLIPAHGFPLSYVSSGKWKGGGAVSKLFGLIFLAFGTLKFFVTSFFSPRADLLISVGGYVSLPVVITAALRKVPIVLMEPNIRAGLANRVASRWARFAVATPGSDASVKFKCKVFESGVPVRKSMSAVTVRDRGQFILVLGGSQGAKPLTEAMLKVAKHHDFASLGLMVKIQVGAAHMEYAKVLKKNLGLGDEVELVSFIDDMAAAYQSADLVVARAGALTVAELAAVGMPTIFVPFPHAADNHQMVNAQMLRDSGAADLVDQMAADFEAQLADKILTLTQVADASEHRRSMSVEFSKWARPEAAESLHSMAKNLI